MHRRNRAPHIHPAGVDLSYEAGAALYNKLILQSDAGRAGQLHRRANGHPAAGADILAGVSAGRNGIAR